MIDIGLSKELADDRGAYSPHSSILSRTRLAACFHETSFCIWWPGGANQVTDEEDERTLTCTVNEFHTHPIFTGSVPCYIWGDQAISLCCYTMYPRSRHLFLDPPQRNISEHHIPHPRHRLFVVHAATDEFLDVRLRRMRAKEGPAHEPRCGKRGEHVAQGPEGPGEAPRVEAHPGREHPAHAGWGDRAEENEAGDERLVVGIRVGNGILRERTPRGMSNEDRLRGGRVVEEDVVERGLQIAAQVFEPHMNKVVRPRGFSVPCKQEKRQSDRRTQWHTADGEGTHRSSSLRTQYAPLMRDRGATGATPLRFRPPHAEAKSVR